MDNKITEALKNILPENQVSEVSKAVEEMISDQYKVLEDDFNKKLEEAYEQLAEERKADEQTTEEGYQQAYEIIGSLMKRIEKQREEFESALEEGFEEAYQEIQKEKAKNGNVEADLYDEFDKKLREMKDFMVDKVDQFLSLQENEIYEHAKRDVLTDPQVAEQRVAVAKMAEILSDYIDRDDLGTIATNKVEEAVKEVENLKGRVRMLEGRNVKLSAQNTKLNEQVREAENIINEATKNSKKERAEKAKNASGSGKRVMDDDQIISEYVNPDAKKSDSKAKDLVEGHDALNDLLILSGIEQS